MKVHKLHTEEVKITKISEEHAASFNWSLWPWGRRQQGPLKHQ